MTDCELLEADSGPAGGLASMASSCNEINDGITKALDQLWGADKTDTFDASCNTCKHFQRQTFNRKERLVSVWGFPGTCAKTGDSVTGWPRGQFCGHACYENRRTADPSPHENHFHRP